MCKIDTRKWKTAQSNCKHLDAFSPDTMRIGTLYESSYLSLYCLMLIWFISLDVCPSVPACCWWRPFMHVTRRMLHANPKSYAQVLPNIQKSYSCHQK